MNQPQAVSSREAVTPMIAGELGSEREIVHFPSGLAGFENCRSFVLLSEEAAAFQCLSAVDGPPASFLVIDPRRILPTYRYAVSRTDLERLRATSENGLLWLAIVLVEADGTIAANLRAPIVINPDAMVGVQIIPQDCVYPLRHVIVPAAGV